MNQSRTVKLYALLLVVIIGSAVVILSYIALKQIKQTTLDQTKDSLQTILFTVQEAHNILVEQRRVTISTIAQSDHLITLTEDLLARHSNNQNIAGSKPLKQLRKFIKPVLDEFGDQGFFIIAPDKVSIASMHNAHLGNNNLINEHFPSLLDQSFLGDSIFIPAIPSALPLQKSNTKIGQIDSTMFITTPIQNANEDVIAVFVLRINPMSYFSAITMISRLGKSGETYAFDRRGQLLTQSRFVEQLRKVNQVHFDENNRYTVQLKDPGGNILLGHSPTVAFSELPYTYMASKALSGQSGVNTEGYRDYRGVVVVGAWLWDKKYHFGLATEINQTEVLQSYYDTRNTFIWVLSLVLLLSLLMLRVLYKTLHQNKLEILRINQYLEDRVEERTKDLKVAKEALSNLNVELEVLAITDALTNLYNRRYFDEQYSIEWQRCLRDKKSIAIILFDIDYFKQYNDYYGHLAGDRCLVEIAKFLSQANISKRPSDIIARYGGEEFIVLLSNPTEQYCSSVAQLICKGIRDLNMPHERSALSSLKRVTVSIGYASTHDLSSSNQTQLISKADTALYRAKQVGRNCVLQYFEERASNVTSIHKKQPPPS